MSSREHEVVESLFGCFFYAICIKLWRATACLRWEEEVVGGFFRCFFVAVCVQVDALAGTSLGELRALHDLIFRLDCLCSGRLSCVDDLYLD